jgi:hypothetical protein
MDDKSIQTILPIQRIRLRSLIRCTSSFCSGRPPLCPFTPFSGCSSALRPLGKLTAGLLVCILSVLCWRWRNAPVATRQFSWALAWVASVTLVIIPKLAAYNQPLLIPALLVLLAHREEIGKARLFSRALAKAPFVCLFWQWATAVILSLRSLLIPASQLQPAVGVSEYTLLALPPVAILAVAVTTLTLFFADAITRTPPANLPIPPIPAARRE